MKLLITTVATTLSLITCSVIAQSKPTTKNEQAPKQASAPSAKGPTGLGPLKIGMTKQAVEELKESDGVYLSSPLSAHEYKYDKPEDGVDKFDAKLKTSIMEVEAPVILSFEAEKLLGFSLELDTATPTLALVRSQIAEKYGPGKTVERESEEQCIYKNGSNFKVKSKFKNTSWVQKTSASETISTTIHDMSLEFCPSNLRYGSVGPHMVQQLNIEKVRANNKESKTKPASNLF